MTASRFALCLMLFPMFAHATPPSWALTVLEKHKGSLFDEYPPVVCALQTLLGKDYATLIDAENDGGSPGLDDEVLGTADRAGGVAEFRALWQSASARLLWVHPDGGLIVGLAFAEEPFRIVTNRASLKERPPAVVTAFVDWVRTVEDRGGELPWKEAVPVWDVRSRDLAECRGDASEAEAEIFRAIGAGKRCDANIATMGIFADAPMLIVPEKGQLRVALAPEPRPLRDGEKAAFLVDGDVVQLLLTDALELAEQAGFVCAYYRAKSGTVSAGWVPRPRAVPIPQDRAALTALLKPLGEPKGWLPKARNWLGFPGKHADTRYSVGATIQLRGKRLTLKLGSTFGGREGDPPSGEDETPVCENTVRLTLEAPRVGTGEDDHITVVAVRFNNALWIEAGGFCDDNGFKGLFYPVP